MGREVLGREVLMGSYAAWLATQNDQLEANDRRNQARIETLEYALKFVLQEYDKTALTPRTDSIGIAAIRKLVK